MVARQTMYKEDSFFQTKLSWLKEARTSLLKKLEQDNQPKLRKIKLIGLNQISRRLAITAYTAGESIDSFADHAKNYVTDKVAYLDETGTSLMPDGSLEQYIDCLWLLSFCYFFDVDLDTTNRIARSIPEKYCDKLVDRLVYACNREYRSMSQEIAFPSVYQDLGDAIGIYDSKPRNDLIFTFANKYYGRLIGNDVTWHDSHTESDYDYCKHFGYWLFELAVLMVDINWEDTSVREHSMYPKDLVDWKRSNSANHQSEA